MRSSAVLKHAGRLDEELVLRRSVRMEVGLVERPRGLLDHEVVREGTLVQLRHDGRGRRTHAPRLVHDGASLVQEASGQIAPDAGWEEVELPP